MKGGPTPGCGIPPDPAGVDLYRVAYRTVRGETYSRLFRQGAAAERFAQKVAEHGGQVRVHFATISRWREMPTCRYCHPGAGHHDHLRERGAL